MDNKTKPYELGKYALKTPTGQNLLVNSKYIMVELRPDGIYPLGQLAEMIK